MKYSIVVPVHNAEPYLEQCIQSVLSQSFGDLEIVLVDDGSEDASLSICKDFQARDPRVSVIHQECQGVSAARNAGIEAAEGAYIIFLDSDDYWTDAGALALIDAQNNDADIVRFDLKTVPDGADDHKIAPDGSNVNTRGQYETGAAFLQSALRDNPEFLWYSCLYAFKKELWNEPAPLRYPVGIRYHEDTAVIYRAILRARQTTVLEDCVYVYRKNSAAVSRKDTPELLINRISVNLEQIGWIEANPEIPDTLKDLLCRNMATAFYVDLIRVGALPANERREMLRYLRQYKDRFCKYPATAKQKSVNVMLDKLGMNMTCRILHIRRVLKERRKYER